LCVLGEGKQLAGGGGKQQQGMEAANDTQEDRNWSSLGRQKEMRWILTIIHILWNQETIVEDVFSPGAVQDDDKNMLMVFF
jgi:hypothetical protein